MIAFMKKQISKEGMINESKEEKSNTRFRTFNGRDNYNIELSCSYTVGGTRDLHTRMHLSDIIETITRPRVLASFKVTFLTSLIASIINSIMGVILAWVLVRYDFPLKRVLDGMIELPFALPTAVAGLALANLTTEEGLIGKLFAPFGIKIAHTRIGIVVALIFIGIPFVVRAVQPVLEKLDPSYEEAAGALGANRGTIFRKVILPEIIPPALTGFGLALGRCIGEYGSVIFIAGNKPYETEITPLIIMSGITGL